VRLEDMTAELRPRSEWEAVDLGLAMARRDFWLAGGAWWLGMLPALLGLAALWPWLGGWGFVIGFWWWLPVAARMQLFVLSRRLFGERPGARALLRHLPGAIGRRFWHRMLLARLSPWRPLTMPVEELEGLRGGDFRRRCAVLMRRGDSTLMVLALWRLLLSGWLTLGLFAALFLFLPTTSREVWGETFAMWFDDDWQPAPAGMVAAMLVSVCGAIGLVDFYSTGAGFGIYVNHRTWVEGWDIELAFRKLANRLGAGVALLAVAWLGLAVPLSGREPQQVVEEILKHEDFTEHTETFRVPAGGSGGSGGPGPGASVLLELIGPVLAVLSIGVIVALLVWLVIRYRHLLVGPGRGGGDDSAAPARVVMGMEVAPESLPDDVVEAARRLWAEGRHQQALGLLYRGAISWLIHRGGVEIAESDTESDCLGRVRHAGLEQAGYFDELTRVWMRLAYARRLPEESQLEGLWNGWPFRERGRG